MMVYSRVYTIIEAVNKLNAGLLFMKLCSASRNCSMKLAGNQLKAVKSKQIVNFWDVLPWDCVEAENINQLKMGLRLTHGQHVYKQILKALGRDVPSYTSNIMIVDAGKEMDHRKCPMSCIDCI